MWGCVCVGVGVGSCVGVCGGVGVVVVVGGEWVSGCACVRTCVRECVCLCGERVILTGGLPLVNSDSLKD